MAASVEGVILAAGLSSRVGQYKMTLPLGDKTVIEKAIEGMVAIARQVFVVVGWQAERIEAVLAGYAKVTLVPNPHFREGMFSSVRAGLAQVSASRVFLLPGDCALVGANVYAQLLSVPSPIVIPTYQGRKGHPVLLDGQLVPEILNLPQDATLRDYIQGQGFAAVEVDDEGILLDIDTLEDYDSVRASLLKRTEG